MVEHALRGTPSPPFDRMSVVEADQALAMLSMQRQRIIEAVRLGLANRDALDDEPDPMPSLWIDDKNLPVQVKQASRDGSRFTDYHYQRMIRESLTICRPDVAPKQNPGSEGEYERLPCWVAGRIPVGLTANNVEHTASEGEKITRSGHGGLAERTNRLI
jgi:hypothetical protein